jgi:phosphoribosyl 1,2-cyclic phosphate phosphodiesterase
MIGKESLVIDTGPDFRQQMLREGIPHINALLFTHAHRDHTAGLDDVRAYNFLQKMHMPVYGDELTLSQIKNDFAYIFGDDSYPGLPQLDLVPITNQKFNINGVDIVPLPVLHLKLPVLGFRIGDFSYVTDANLIPKKTFEKLKGTKILVLNALQRDSHISHFNLAEAIAVVKMVKPAKAYFTHISHKLGSHAQVEKELQANVYLAYDGLKLSL